MILHKNLRQRLVSWLCLTLALTLSGCSEESSGGEGPNYDDKNVYVGLDADANGCWDYEAHTSRDVDAHPGLCNIDFVCDHLRFGYYRAMLTVVDKDKFTTYTVYTLDENFNVVGYITPDAYYVVTRTPGGYQIKEAGEFRDELPQPGDGGKKMPRSADDVYYKKIAQAIIDFHQDLTETAVIDKAEWREMLRRILADDVKPVRSAPYYTFAGIQALLDYELDNIINQRLADVRTYSLHGISPILEGMECRNGKMEIHLNFSDHSYTTDDDFRNVKCGLLLYDFYDRWRLFPLWLEPKSIDRYGCTLTYDLPTGLDWVDYVFVPYLINADYVKSDSPLVMFDDMIVKGSHELTTRLLPDNSIRIDKVYCDYVAHSEGGGDGQYIRVTGHASCDVDPGSMWTIDYAYLPKDYQEYGPWYPSGVSPLGHGYAKIVDTGEKEVDFDVRIPIMKEWIEMDVDNSRASADLMLYITDGGNGLGDYTFCRWTYSGMPSLNSPTPGSRTAIFPSPGVTGVSIVP